MPPEIPIPREVSPSEKDTHHRRSLIPGIPSLPQVNLPIEKKLVENRLVVAKGGMGERGSGLGGEVGVSRCKLWH